MELELGLALFPTRKFADHGIKNKQSFAEAFEGIGGGGGGGGGEKLALFSWINGQPNEEDDGNGEKKRTSNASINDKNEGQDDHVVGWPPIKSWRKKLLHRHHCGGCRRANHQSMALEGGRRLSGRPNSAYVKVKMEGIPIGRKINLRLYHSYQALKNALISMFATHHECDENDANYTITYQDQEGDWLLAGDVPWQTFVQSACRLEILRNAGS